MLRVSLKNIQDFDLPLDTTEAIIKREDSKKKLRGLEKKYGLKSHLVCRKYRDTYYLYTVDHTDISEMKKKYWIETYKNYVASSIQYKFWIAFYKLFNV